MFAGVALVNGELWKNSSVSIFPLLVKIKGVTIEPSQFELNSFRLKLKAFSKCTVGIWIYIAPVDRKRLF